MKAVDFAYWLQGMFELGNPQTLDARQTALIRAHLALVFKHEIDPSVDGGDQAKAQELQDIHDGHGFGGKGPGGTVYRC